MQFIKKNRYTIIIILVFILLLVLGIKLKNILIPDNNKASYGNRLDDIKDYPIEDSFYKNIKEKFESMEGVDSLSYRTQGKIINFIVTVKDDMTTNDATKIGDEIVKDFDEDSLSYYTIQIYLNKKDEKLNNFPMIGTKNPLSNNISWTHDREIVESESNNESQK